MKTLELLKQHQLDARRNGDKILTGLYSNLLSRIDFHSGKEIGEDEVLLEVKREAKAARGAIDSMNSMLKDAYEGSIVKLMYEIEKNKIWLEILENMLPKTLTSDEIADIIVLESLRGLSVKDAKKLATSKLDGQEYEMSTLMPLIMKSIK